MYEAILIINFITLMISFSVGFWIGVNTNQKTFKKKIKKGKMSIKGLTETAESGIIKSLSPRQIEAKKKLEFERKYYG